MKILKRISLLFLICLALLSVKAFAGYQVGEENSTEDPMNNIKKQSVKSGSLESISSIISKFEDGTAAVGIDVSSHQGEIDWEKVANSGVKYAIIRCGYRGLSEGKIYEDKCFKKNIEGAINNGIYVGVYFFSTALNEEEAIEEANMTLDLIKGYDIKYFVAYDFETFEVDSNRTDNLDINQINKNGQAFLSKIKEKGYTASLYGSAYYLKEKWKMNDFSNYDVWVAHYYVNKPSYSGHQIWQYSDNGQVSGISTAVDIDVDNTYFFKYNHIDISPFMFDAVYYADCNPDLKAVFGYNATLLKSHFDNFGKKEGRAATPIFDAGFYLKKYPDLKAAYGKDYAGAYDHFVTFGAKEGRQGSKYIDSTYYLKKYTDLRRAFYSSKTRAIAHFYQCGISEGRQGSSEFNVKNYRTSTSAYYQHHLGYNYMKYLSLDVGGSPVLDNNIDISQYMFDAKFYADKYPDLKAAFGYNETLLRSHFDNFGKKEGRQASRIFDPMYYLNTYADLKAAYGNNYVGAFDHFMVFGAAEGRSGSEELQVKKYLENYYDLSAAFGTYYTKAIAHYVNCGVAEGRKGN